jgi:centrosomal protein CEP104
MPQYQNLGFFQLDDNRQSNYQSRELKTVYLEVICQQFRIQLGKNYDNRLNKFNQVGLVKMLFEGQYLGNYELQQVYPPQQHDHWLQQKLPKIEHFQAKNDLRPRNLKIQSVQEQEMEPEIQQKLRLLQMKKEEAVQLEDYDTALRLKALVDKLKINGHKLMQLEAQKQEAVDGEDFLSAKALKADMDQLRQECHEIDAVDPFQSHRQLTMD